MVGEAGRAGLRLRGARATVKDEILEIAMYRTRPDIDREQFLRDSAPADGWLRSQSGFVERTLLEADGQWFDVVRWASLANAQAAAAAFESAAASDFATAPELRGLMSAIDPATVGMFHAREVTSDR